jgi:hypothetical protein
MEEKKERRGRPKKGSEESSDSLYLTTIKDPIISPFYIQKDKSNFTVFETTQPTKGFGGKELSGKELDKFVGHYTCFGNALKVIAKRKFYTNQPEFASIKEYMNTWKVLKDEIETLFNKIEI